MRSLNAIEIYVEFVILFPKGSYHNSKPVKVGKPSHGGGGGLGFYLGFPNLEVGKWFLLGGVSKSTR